MSRFDFSQSEHSLFSWLMTKSAAQHKKNKTWSVVGTSGIVRSTTSITQKKCPIVGTLDILGHLMYATLIVFSSEAKKTIHCFQNAGRLSSGWSRWNEGCQELDVHFQQCSKSNSQAMQRALAHARQPGMMFATQFSKEKNRKTIFSWHQNVSKCEWTEEEDKAAMELIEKHGRRWAIIAASMPGRYSLLSLDPPVQSLDDEGYFEAFSIHSLSNLDFHLFNLLSTELTRLWKTDFTANSRQKWENISSEFRALWNQKDALVWCKRITLIWKWMNLLDLRTTRENPRAPSHQTQNKVKQSTNTQCLLHHRHQRRWSKLNNTSGTAHEPYEKNPKCFELKTRTKRAKSTTWRNAAPVMRLKATSLDRNSHLRNNDQLITTTL